MHVTGTDGNVAVLRGEHLLIATGSSPFRPPEFPFEHPRVHDSNEILDIETLPRVLAVVGAGVIGCEYASTFSALGTQVHPIDGRQSLLPFLDGEISRTLTEAMAALSVRLHLGERVAQCQVDAGGAMTLRLASGASLACDDVLVCSGEPATRKT